LGLPGPSIISVAVREESKSMLSSDADKLKAIIDKAIENQGITCREYEEILAVADADMKFYPQRRRLLLSQLRDLISSDAVRRVPG